MLAAFFYIFCKSNFCLEFRQALCYNEFKQAMGGVWPPKGDVSM